ncbi:hypothetical protein NLI96_g2181 [Meripilus lineatus]|uniref:Uncharacterized protein n=1 Tax=Meripilus lineatus TaxID=2056292 RepID=A0AAD5YM84_9APHY|nr:hypothetical protein NLI96_g2181 [Physisporinus lineatus]
MSLSRDACNLNVQKLQKIGLELLQGEQGPTESVQFFESLSYLPASLRSVSLLLPIELPRAYTSDNPPEYLNALDSNLGGSNFLHLTCVEVIWHMYPDTINELYSLLQLGKFAVFMPKIYSRGILWIGSFPGVYPISASALTLAARDPTAWMDSSRPSLFFGSW